MPTVYVLAQQFRSDEIVHVRSVLGVTKALCGESPVPVLIFAIGEGQSMCKGCSGELEKHIGTPTFLVMRRGDDDE